jgi:hypothetical protein
MFTKKPFLERRLIPPLLGAVLAVSAVGWGALFPTAGRAQSCDGCCGPHWAHCPPPYVHCTERPPNIRFKCVCPRPVCVPCDQEFWGYYPTCWRRWPAPYANCPDRNPPWVAVAPPCPGPNCPLEPHPEVLPDGVPAGPGNPAAPATSLPPAGAPAQPLKAPGQPSRLPYLSAPAAQPRLSTSLSTDTSPQLVPPVGQEMIR